MPVTVLFPNIQISPISLTMVSIFKAVVSLSFLSVKDHWLKNEDLSLLNENDVHLIKPNPEEQVLTPTNRHIISVSSRT